MVIITYRIFDIEEQKAEFIRTVFSDDDIRGIQSHLDTLKEKEHIKIERL